MNHDQFVEELRERLFPILHGEGFEGSGNTLRRFRDPVIHVFNIQGSSAGTHCYLNLGAHLLFLETPDGSKPDPAKVEEYECVFRDRFDSASGAGFGWPYGKSEEEMRESVTFICDQWSLYGHGFYRRYSQYPEDFLALVNETDALATHPIELHALAQIARHLGEADRSVWLAVDALRRCPKGAEELRAKLKEFLKK